LTKKNDIVSEKRRQHGQ